jgi:hypothetical protein
MLKMKSLPVMLILLMMMSCSSNDKPESSSPRMVENFLNDTRSLDRIESDNVITDFAVEAKSIADFTLDVTAESMANFLAEGKKYSHGIIIVGNHTIVRIDDFEKCEPSSSWSACMPFGEGYIKKGDLEFKKEYVNNIIGRPDKQQRVGYLFK